MFINIQLASSINIYILFPFDTNLNTILQEITTAYNHIDFKTCKELSKKSKHNKCGNFICECNPLN